MKGGAVDEIEDPDVLAALRLIGARARASGRDVCPGCGDAMASGADLCDGCRADGRRRELERKRDYWHQGPVLARPVHQAAFWLRKQLRRGPLDSREVKRRARQAGIALRTLRRAATRLEVRYDRAATGRTTWRLP